jgi:hypothetical protein
MRSGFRVWLRVPDSRARHRLAPVVMPHAARDRGKLHEADVPSGMATCDQDLPFHRSTTAGGLFPPWFSQAVPHSTPVAQALPALDAETWKRPLDPLAGPTVSTIRHPGGPAAPAGAGR